MYGARDRRLAAENHDRVKRLAAENRAQFKVLQAEQEANAANLHRKLDAVLNAVTEEPGAEPLTEVFTLPGSAFSGTNPLTELDAVKDAIKDEVVISFTYVSEDLKTATRILSPYEVKETAQGPRVLGYDHLRQGIRQFSPVGIDGVNPEPSYEFVPAEVKETTYHFRWDTAGKPVAPRLRYAGPGFTAQATSHDEAMKQRAGCFRSGPYTVQVRKQGDAWSKAWTYYDPAKRFGKR